MMAPEEFVQQDGDLDVHYTAQFLLSCGYQHDQEWREGRYRTFKHADNPKMLTFREWPDGRIIHRQADRVRKHVRRTFGLEGGEQNEESDAE